MTAYVPLANLRVDLSPTGREEPIPTGNRSLTGRGTRAHTWIRPPRVVGRGHTRGFVPHGLND